MFQMFQINMFHIHMFQINILLCITKCNITQEILKVAMSGRENGCGFETAFYLLFAKFSNYMDF